MKKTSLLLLVLALCSCSSLRVFDSRSKKTGYWYALPKNIIVVEIPVKKRTYKRKECFDAVNNAFPQLNLTDEDTNSVSFSLGKATITTRAVPDTAKVYSIEPSNRFIKNSNYSFVYSDLGVLNSSELQNENKLFDVVIETVGAVANIAGNFVSKGEIIKADASKCKQILDLLMDIQQKRYALISSNDTRTAKEVFEKQLQMLDAAQANIMENFVVSNKTEEYVLRFNFTPTPGILSKDLFKFSRIEGVSLISSNGGAYEEESITDELAGKIKRTNARFDNAELVKISISNNTSAAQLSDNSILTSNSSDQKGFVFNVPAYVTASLTKGNGSISKSNLLIAQLGKTSKLTHKVSKLSIELDPSTGAIKKISGQNTAVGPDAVKKSGETINNTISTFKKEKETELEALTKERQILEEKKKIMDLKKAIEE